MTPAKKTWIILVGIAASEAVPVVLYTLRGGPRFARYLGFAGPSQGTLLGWILALACAAAYTWNATRRSPVIRENFLRINAQKIFAVLIFAPVTGIFEEMYFRKALMEGVLTHGGGPVLQIILSALLFGLAHGIWGLIGRSLRIAIGATVATGLLGGMLAVVYLAAGRSVAPCIVSHALINAFLEPWLILAAASRSWGSLQTGPAEAVA